MSGLLFLFDVIAFVIVAAWAYSNDGPGKSGEKGLLGLRSDDPAAAGGSVRGGPRWRRDLIRPGDQSAGALKRPASGWRRSFGARPPAP